MVAPADHRGHRAVVPALADLIRGVPPTSKARIYFAAQAVAGALWSLTVFASADHEAGWGAVLMTISTRWRLEWAPLQHSVWARVGPIVFVVASALGIWSCVSMALRGEGTPLPVATARNLVVVGPYRFVRNPMAVAGAFRTIGVGLWLGSWMVILSSLAGALIWNTYIRPAEEADLAARFGADYESYRDVVRCWIPTARPLNTGRTG